MAYTSIIPVSRLDNSITYIRNKDKTTKKGQSAGSLEEAIDYAMNRDKTERSVFEDAIGCVCETAYQDMVATKKRYHKMDGVQGYHLVQSFVKGEVTPELAHQIGMEMAERLLQGKYEAVITTHLNTEHYHNHIVFNSVSMEDGKKYHRVDSYMSDDNLYIGLYHMEDGYPESFADLTVNLPFAPLGGINEAYIDHNFSKEKLRFIKQHKLGTIQPDTASSGYCIFQRVAFDLKKLAELDPEGTKRFMERNGIRQRDVPKQKQKKKQRLQRER